MQHKTYSRQEKAQKRKKLFARSTMTFGKGTQLVPHGKRAAPAQAIGGRRTKELRKQAETRDNEEGDEDECEDEEGDDVEGE